MAASTMFFTEDPALQLDDVLYEICEDIQLSRFRHEQAQERYKALAHVLESEESPFRLQRPFIYPQGSMRLGTTVRPLRGPHDLDFVMQLSRSHNEIRPMTLLLTLFKYLNEHSTYGPMVSLKNRCVRIEYANEFYLDILPACLNLEAGANCIKVPDRQLQEWKDSNPIGYAEWFTKKSETALLKVVLARAIPVPNQQTAEQKHPLQLVVQLLKRWRDVYYKNSCEIAPISIVLTTLAAKHYDGDDCINSALAKILDRICNEIQAADASHSRIQVCNPANPSEDLSERWDSDWESYEAFTEGMRSLRRQWNLVLTKSVNVNTELERLFGETVQIAVIKQAKRVQELRSNKLLGVKPSGIITGVGAAGTLPMRSNTYHGQK
jgi:Second Messenger Oligonucleotide or Dinucleotide Synthetase domain